LTRDAKRDPHARAVHVPQRRQLHGRRKARPLRPGQQRAMEELLPRLQLPLPAEGERPLDPFAAFDPRPAALWLEIGFGAGEHLAWQAAQNPDVGLIGAEVFQDGVARLLKRVEEEGLEANVRLHHGDGRALLDLLPDACLARVFVLFPDPWPKTKHHKRRIVQQAQLDQIARVLVDGGELRLATDDPSYQRWMLIECQRHPAFQWTARRPADWQQRGADWPATRYEQKAVGEGRTPIFLRYRRVPR
jgi:tRNA (guanine-N7-)-methyltransferase